MNPAPPVMARASAEVLDGRRDLRGVVFGQRRMQRERQLAADLFGGGASSRGWFERVLVGNGHG
jgi:hypothetical protein